MPARPRAKTRKLAFAAIVQPHEYTIDPLFAAFQLWMFASGIPCREQVPQYEGLAVLRKDGDVAGAVVANLVNKFR